MAKRKNKHGRKRHAPAGRDLDAQLLDLAVANNRGLLESTRLLYRDIVTYQEQLGDCIHFEFFNLEHIADMTTKGHGYAAGMFWHTFSSLMVFCLKAESSALGKILEVLTWSIALENELGMALAGRSLIEHVAAISALAKIIEPMRARLVDRVWPAFGANEVAPVDEDRNAFARLLRFALGRRVQQTTPLPLSSDSKGAWERFNKSLETSVPAELKLVSIQTEVENLGKRQLPVLYTVYAFLSEYCHPNSSSRSFEFVRLRAETSTAAIFAGPSSIGRLHITQLLNVVLPDVCSEASRSLQTLDRARRPMHALERKNMQPFPGATGVIDDFGRRFWVDSDEAEVLDIAGVDLTDEQQQRALASFAVLSELLGGDAKQFIVELGKERSPAREIRIWERMAQVFQRELKLRGETTKEGRALLYDAIRASTFVDSLEELRVVAPAVVRVPELERVFRAVKHGVREG